MKRTSTFALLAAAALTLAACGGTTVDSDDVTATPTQTESKSQSESPSTSASSSAETSSSETASPEPEQDLGGEGAASEVEDFPEDVAHRAPEDEAYLEALRKGGVDITGNEEQLLSTARTVCQGSPITRDAVAGQLIEQERTTLNHKQLTELIDASAHDTLC